MVSSITVQFESWAIQIAAAEAALMEPMVHQTPLRRTTIHRSKMRATRREDEEEIMSMDHLQPLHRQHLMRGPQEVHHILFEGLDAVGEGMHHSRLPRTGRLQRAIIFRLEAEVEAVEASLQEEEEVLDHPSVDEVEVLRLRMDPRWDRACLHRLEAMGRAGRASEAMIVGIASGHCEPSVAFSGDWYACKLAILYVIALHVRACPAVRALSPHLFW